MAGSFLGAAHDNTWQQASAAASNQAMSGISARASQDGARRVQHSVHVGQNKHDDTDSNTSDADNLYARLESLTIRDATALGFEDTKQPDGAGKTNQTAAHMAAAPNVQSTAVVKQNGIIGSVQTPPAGNVLHALGAQPSLHKLLEAKIETARLARELLAASQKQPACVGTSARQRTGKETAMTAAPCEGGAAPCTVHAHGAQIALPAECSLLHHTPRSTGTQPPQSPDAATLHHVKPRTPALRSPPSSPESPYRRAAQRVRAYCTKQRASQVGAARTASPHARHAYDRRLRKEGVPRRTRSASAYGSKACLVLAVALFLSALASLPAGMDMLFMDRHGKLCVVTFMRTGHCFIVGASRS